MRILDAFREVRDRGQSRAAGIDDFLKDWTDNGFVDGLHGRLHRTDLSLTLLGRRGFDLSLTLLRHLNAVESQATRRYLGALVDIV